MERFRWFDFVVVAGQLKNQLHERSMSSIRDYQALAPTKVNYFLLNQNSLMYDMRQPAVQIGL